MNKELPPIAEIMERAMAWAIHDKDTFSVVVSSLTTETLHVPNSVVTQAHRQLADALQAQLDWRERSYNQTCISGVDALTTQGLLENRYINFRNAHGVEKFFQHVDNVFEAEGIVRIQGVWVSAMTSQSAGQDIRFVTGRFPLTHSLTSEVMEENFPGWSSRWTIANALGLEGEQRMHYVFTTMAPENMVDLSDITLD